jgi:hypothetical protein
MILGYQGKKEPISHIKTLMGYYGNVQSKYLSHGQAFEPLARECYQTETGNTVTQCGLIVSNEYHFLAASPDGSVTDKDGGLGVLEIKCPYCQKGEPLRCTDIMNKGSVKLPS